MLAFFCVILSLTLSMCVPVMWSQKSLWRTIKNELESEEGEKAGSRSPSAVGLNAGGLQADSVSQPSFSLSSVGPQSCKTDFMQFQSETNDTLEH